MGKRLTKGESDILNTNIQNLRNEGFTQQEIADRFDISQTNEGGKVPLVIRRAMLSTGGWLPKKIRRIRRDK